MMTELFWPELNYINLVDIGFNRMPCVLIKISNNKLNALYLSYIFYKQKDSKGLKIIETEYFSMLIKVFICVRYHSKFLTKINETM